MIGRANQGSGMVRLVNHIAPSYVIDGSCGKGTNSAEVGQGYDRSVQQQGYRSVDQMADCCSRM